MTQIILAYIKHQSFNPATLAFETGFHTLTGTRNFFDNQRSGNLLSYDETYKKLTLMSTFLAHYLF